MRFADKLNLAGVVLTAAGSSLGMFGILLQTNGYYAFKWLGLFRHIYLVLKSLVRKGASAAWRTVEVTAELAEKKGEDRAKSLIGLYLVLFGFFLQLLGAVFLAAGILEN
jgi:hypothetical protein